MDNGWVKISRKILDWGWIQDVNTLALWIHILLRVNVKDKWWKGHLVKRGQMVTSLGHLASMSGLTMQNVRTALEHLKLTNEISCTSTNKFTIITVHKWDDYQLDLIDANKQVTSELTSEQQSTNNQLTTTKELENKEYIYTTTIITNSEAEKKFDSEAKVAILRSLYADDNWVSDIGQLCMMPTEQIKDLVHKFALELKTGDVDDSRDEHELQNHLKNYIRLNKQLAKKEERSNDTQRKRDKRRGYDVTAKSAAEYSTEL